MKATFLCGLVFKAVTVVCAGLCFAAGENEDYDEKTDN